VKARRYAPAVSEFLTPAWITELDAALRASSFVPEQGDGPAFVVEQHISATPTGDVCYHLVLDGAERRAVAGAATAPNLVILTDYETAVGLLRGDTNAQHAIADGRMKIRGDLHTIGRRIDTLAGLDDVFAVLRESTTCAPPLAKPTRA
jgi:hypothetical protein